MNWKWQLPINGPIWVCLLADGAEGFNPDSMGGTIFALMWMLCVVIFTIGELYRERKYR